MGEEQVPDALTGQGAEEEPGVTSSAVTPADNADRTVSTSSGKGIEESDGGVPRGSMNTAHRAMRLGFNVARFSTNLGFSIGRSVIQAHGRVAAKLTGNEQNPLTTVLKGVDTTVEAAHMVTLGSLVVGEGLASKTIEATDTVLEKAGAYSEKTLGTIVSRALGLDSSGTELLSFFLSLQQEAFPLLKECGPRAFGEGVKAVAALQRREAAARWAARRAGAGARGLMLHRDRPDVPYYMRFAAAAYGAKYCAVLGLTPLTDGAATWGNRRCVEHLTGVPGENVVCEQWSGQFHQPAHFLAVDHRQKSVILSISGTGSAHDLLTDLNCDPTEVEAHALNLGQGIDFGSPGPLKGFVHKGFLEAARVLSEKLQGTVAATLAELEGYSLVVCGHSLGAATGSLLTLLWLPAFHAKHRLHCYAYAPPAVLDATLSHLSRPYVTSTVLGNDMIPRFSLLTVRDLIAAVHWLCTTEDGIKHRKWILADARGGLDGDGDGDGHPSGAVPSAERGAGEHVDGDVLPDIGLSSQADGSLARGHAAMDGSTAGDEGACPAKASGAVGDTGAGTEGGSDPRECGAGAGAGGVLAGGQTMSTANGDMGGAGVDTTATGECSGAGGAEGSTWQQVLQQFLRSSIMQFGPKLYPAGGQVLHVQLEAVDAPEAFDPMGGMRPSDRMMRVVTWCDVEHFSEIILEKNMFSVHLPHRYVQELFRPEVVQ